MNITAAYDRVVVDGRYADELSKRYDLANAEMSRVFTMMGILTNFRYPLLKGVLHLDYGGEGDMLLLFELTDDVTGNGTFTHHDGNGAPRLRWSVKGGEITLERFFLGDHKRIKDDLMMVSRYLTNLFRILMQKMATHPEVVEKDETRVPRVKKGKGGKKKKNRTVYVRQVVYRFKSTPPPPPSEEREKRSYERQTFRWTRKGHYRRLRNGEVRWFPEKEIILDPDAQREAKTYKIRKGKGE